METKLICFGMDKFTNKALTWRAKKHSITRSHLVNELVAEYLRKNKV